MFPDQKVLLFPLHKKLEYLGCKNIIKILLGFDLNMDSIIKNSVLFEPCIYAKHCREPFIELILPRTSRPLKLFHSDVCG